MKSLLTLAGVVAAAAVLITSAGAGTGTIRKIDLSTHSGAVKYLKSLGVDPKGVVIQRGMRNYAGPSCPGRRWACTHAKRVFQIAATGGTNKYQCTGYSGPTPSDPLNCSITQNATGGDNVANCIEDESSNPATETCTIVQTNTTGSNNATVDQKIAQSAGATQNASQTSTIDQQNGSGANAAKVAQSIAQATNAAGDQSQTASQSSCVDQHGVETPSDPCSDFDDSVLGTGADKSEVKQSVMQAGNADHDSSQSQSSDITGHVTQQTTGLAGNKNAQGEKQALSGSNGNQTQMGPLLCCTDQGTNFGDTFAITQTAAQVASSNTASQSDFLDAECLTSGNCQAMQTASENGTKTTNSCTGTNCSIAIDCTEGTCEPCTPNGEGGCIIIICVPPFCPGEFTSFRSNSRQNTLAAQRLLLRLRH